MAHDLDIERRIHSHQREQAAAGPLFESFEDRALQRLDAVVARTTVQQATREQQAFLTLLRGHRGSDNPAPLSYFSRQLRLSEREVKSIVQDLRHNFGVQIGASRSSTAGGYYLITNEADSRETANQLIHQAVSMLRTARALRGPHTTAELLGQVRLELETEAKGV